jgi:predicted transport protein
MTRRNYILGRLENWDNKSPVNTDNLTVEHIIPQNESLSPEWKAALGADWRDIQRKYLHTIGNLTLTAYNSEMSDCPFLDKRNMEGGFLQSGLRLNSYVNTQTSWGEEQVKERAARLGEVAKMVWPYPKLTEDELAPFRKSGEPAQQYTIRSYKYLNNFNKGLFDRLDTRIRNLGTRVKREFRKLYVAYKADTNFVDVEFQNSRIRLILNMRFADVIDPKWLCRDVTCVGKWGNGNVEISFTSLDQLDDVMDLIEQSLRKQDVE